MVRPAEFRSQFPFFAAHPGLVYLDSAATTPMPAPVLEAVTQQLRSMTVNPGRGSYRLAGRAATHIDQVRHQVAGLLGADVAGVVFTSGTTEAFDIVVRGWASTRLEPGDEVLLADDDHAATVGGWHALGRARGVLPVRYGRTPSGDPDLFQLAALVTPHTRVVVVTHVHNVYGERADVAGIRRVVGPDIVLVLDAAQSISHVPVEVGELGVDAVAFSGHKMFGPPGVGVLWLSPRLRDDVSALREGGMSSAAQGLARVIERGTPNAPAIAGLGAAIDVLTNTGHDVLHRAVSTVTHALIGALRDVPGLQLLPGVGFSSCGTGYGIVSFGLEGLAPADVGFALDDLGICVRTGAHCSFRSAGARDDSIRVSAHAYTTDEDIDRLAQALHALAARRSARRHAKAQVDLGAPRIALPG